MCDHIIWPVFTPDTWKLSDSIVPKQHPVFLCLLTLVLLFSRFSVCLSVSHHDAHALLFRVTLWQRSGFVLDSDDLKSHSFFSLLSTLSRTKVRGHRAGLQLSSWHLEARAARRSGAWGSVSSTCRNTTFNSCWRTALSSCAPPGQTGPWPSSGSTLRGWRRFVCYWIVFVCAYWSVNGKQNNFTVKANRFIFSYCTEKWMSEMPANIFYPKLCFLFIYLGNVSFYFSGKNHNLIKSACYFIKLEV